MSNNDAALDQEIFILSKNLQNALSGIYHVARIQNTHSTPSDLRNAKLEAITAEYIFNSSIDNILNIYDSTHGTQVTQVGSKVKAIANTMVSKTIKAISTGHGNGAATLLGNSAHGAMGELVGKTASKLDLSVRDSSNKLWKDPSLLIKAIVLAEVYRQGGASHV